MESRNRPILSLCKSSENEISNFYVKVYRTSDEPIGLFCEFVCGILAKKLNLIIPAFNYITLGQHVEDDKKLNDFKNLDHVHPGRTAFGSKVIENTIELSLLTSGNTKIDFNKLAEPNHLIRIGLFDLWIGNKDRTQQHFNLLVRQSKKNQLIVIDHFEAFYGLHDANRLSMAPDKIDIFNTVIGSKYALHMIEYLSKEERKEEVQFFKDKVQKLNIQNLLTTNYVNKPNDWHINNEIVDHMVQFLTNEERLNNIFNEADSLIYV